MSSNKKSIHMNVIEIMFEEFKSLYKKTRNYTLLSEVHSDEKIFDGLIMGSGFACVYSAWEVFVDTKYQYLNVDSVIRLLIESSVIKVEEAVKMKKSAEQIQQKNVDIVLNRSRDIQHTGEIKVVTMKSRKTMHGIESNLLQEFSLWEHPDISEVLNK